MLDFRKIYNRMNRMRSDIKLPTSLLFVSFKLKSHILSLISIIILCLSACIKQPLPPKQTILPKEDQNDRILYILNEGLYNANNATLTKYNMTQQVATTDFFEIKNNRKLGDTGNDIKQYGAKIYIVLTGSNTLDILSNNGISIKQISFVNGSVGRQPRSITFYENNAYVCSFDGTVAVIDTATLAISQYINVGRNPESIVSQNDKLYVTNSGGLDAPNYDSTVSVIDPISNTVIKTINIGINPGAICSDDYGDVYVVSRGDYGSIQSKLYVIEAASDVVKKVFDIEALGIAINKNIAYVHYYDYGNNTSSIAQLDVEKDSVLNTDYISGSNFNTLYAVAIDPITENIYCSDANGFVNLGKVLCFDNKGNKLFDFQTGLNPGSLLFH